MSPRATPAQATVLRLPPSGSLTFFFSLSNFVFLRESKKSRPITYGRGRGLDVPVSWSFFFLVELSLELCRRNHVGVRRCAVSWSWVEKSSMLVIVLASDASELWSGNFQFSSFFFLRCRLFWTFNVPNDMNIRRFQKKTFWWHFLCTLLAHGYVTRTPSSSRFFRSIGGNDFLWTFWAFPTLFFFN